MEHLGGHGRADPLACGGLLVGGKARLGAPDPTGAPADDQEPEFHVPRPAHWGGYRLWADAVELWVEGEHRVHDRARWTRSLEVRDDGTIEPGPWHHHRLQP